MGNNASKTAGGSPSSLDAPHSHAASSSSSHPRKEPRSQSVSGKYANAHTTSHPSPLQHHSHSASSSPTHKQAPPAGRMGNEQSKQRFREVAAQKKDASGPVGVPRAADREKRQRGPDTQFEPSGPPRDLDYVPLSNLNFPPRLPLPIGEEDHTPGSPIITPADLSSVLNEDEIDGVLPRQGSVLSSATAEDDDVAGDELQPHPLDGPRRTVPTTLQWKQGGDRIYVTGTFTSWSRKFRMHRDPNSNIPTAVLQLPPGTHHVKFIVDGVMQLSNELPTAVDYTNILVNYIEVSADDIPADKTSEDGRTPDGVVPTQILSEGTEAQDHAPDTVAKRQQLDGEQPTKLVHWGSGVPEFLFDLEQSEESNRYHRSNKGAADFATPPNIPVFLQKLILNGTTPMKDDNSVLNMPNHTVLNHLATSSIKNQVLATSVTTRYKRKPTDDDGT
ncbi:MAG: hypothetical protein L6R35_000283 [Caloplaca aegaea]|nr:MAG: hypothetical protein L6R35_000283 [Caloplaca aegaea]